MHDQIQQRDDDLDDLISAKRKTSEETVRSIKDERRRLSEEYLAVTDPDGCLRYLRRYVEQAFQRAAAESAAELDGEATPRTDPLCACDSAFCDLKSGEIPSKVRMADDPAAAIDEFRERHSDRPTVLLEAREAYREAEANVWAMLDVCYTAAQRDVPVSKVRADQPADAAAPEGQP